MKLQKLLKDLLPPVLLRVARGMLYRGKLIQFKKIYSDWEQAAKSAHGYEADEIIEKVKLASLKVKREGVGFERDSVVFDEPQYAYPLVAILLKAAFEQHGKLSVLDFGGALGSTFNQSKSFLLPHIDLKWGIIEQEKFVAIGKQDFENDQLRFFYNVIEFKNFLSEKNEKLNVALFSSVLQYLPDYSKIIHDVMDQSPEYILIDRTPFHQGNEHVLTVQYVPASIYKASYPCRIFSYTRLIAELSGKYEKVLNFDAVDMPANVQGVDFYFQGLLFKRIV